MRLPMNGQTLLTDTDRVPERRPVSQNHTATKLDRRIPDLDGIRAIAIWMVLILHILFAFPNNPGALAFVPQPILVLLSHGWFGVDLFFMLSGFLITGI